MFNTFDFILHFYWKYLSQLSYRPFKFSGESDSIKALRKEALIDDWIWCGLVQIA